MLQGTTPLLLHNAVDRVLVLDEIYLQSFLVPCFEFIAINSHYVFNNSFIFYAVFSRDTGDTIKVGS